MAGLIRTFNILIHIVTLWEGSIVWISQNYLIPPANVSWKRACSVVPQSGKCWSSRRFGCDLDDNGLFEQKIWIRSIWGSPQNADSWSLCSLTESQDGLRELYFNNLSWWFCCMVKFENLWTRSSVPLTLEVWSLVASEKFQGALLSLGQGE